MFDVSTLLSTLLGGLLTIAGGITGSYFIQSLSDKTQKRKEVRNIAEALYKDTQSVLFLFVRLERESAGGTIKRAYTTDEIAAIMKEFEERTLHLLLLVDLYFTPIKKEYREYNVELTMFLDEVLTNLKDQQPFSIKKAMHIATTFQQSIIALLQKEGYKYF